MKDKIKFVPLLLLYILVIILAHTNILQNDEGRYVMLAQNLSQGYYSPLDSINLWSGPGYPLVLLPFVIVKLDWIAARILNAFFLFLAIIYFYSTLKMYINKKYALYVSFVLGLYPPLLRDLHMLLTETFLYFLICGFIYHLCKYMHNDKSDAINLMLSSLYLALIALTKIIFGYVILTIIVIFLIMCTLKRKKEIKKVLSIQVIALLLCLPYLFYTYSLTGKIFYWGNSGGMSLYWMSTPYPGELGNWWNWSQVYEEPRLYANHHIFFDNISNLDGVRQDEEFRKQAQKNIREHPAKYLYNWMCNLGRLLFSYPFSYTIHSPTTFYYLIPNMFIIVLSVLCIFPYVLNYNKYPFEITALLLVFAIYSGGSSLICAYERQFRPVFPILFLWISFTLFRVVEIKIRSHGFTKSI